MKAAPPGNRPRVLYVGYFHFPEGNVAALRVLGIGRALRHAGFEVEFAGTESEGRPEDRGADGRYRYDGFQYVSLGNGRPGPRSLRSRVLDYFSSGERMVQWIRSQDLSDVRAIVTYNALSSLGLRLRKLCRERRVPWVVDITEWYDSPWHRGGRIGPRAWDVGLAMRCLNARSGNVMAISSFLERYYVGQGSHTIRVPSLVDFDEGRWKRPARIPGESLPLRFVYAGQAGRKDCLAEILDAFALAKGRGLPVMLELCGMHREEVLQAGPRAPTRVAQLRESLVVHGRLPTPTDALAVISSADVALLVKRPGRTVEAQFPTKLTQYMAAGRPVLANRTGDVATYVRDGEEGLLADGFRGEALVEVLGAFVARRSELSEMGRKSRCRAQSCFDYRSYADPLGEFFSKLRLPG